MRAERRVPRATGSLTVAAVVLLLGVGGMSATTDAAAPVREAVAHAARTVVPASLEANRQRGAEATEAEPEDVADDAPDVATAPLARVGDLVLHVPGADPVVVGFHEASTTAPFPMEPLGMLLGNENTTRYETPQAAPDAAAHPYLILSSRGRAAGPTTAVDIVLRDDEPVLAPVTGVVSDIRPTLLYGQYADVRLELRPDDAADTRIVLVHLEEPVVSVGDRVVVGETVLAPGSRRFPFASQIDRETEPERWPHVHLEVQPWGLRRPGDPPDS